MSATLAVLIGVVGIGLLWLALEKLVQLWPLWVNHEHAKHYVKRELYNYANAQLASAEAIIADLRVALAKEHAMRYADEVRHLHRMTELRKQYPREPEIPAFLQTVSPFKRVN